MPRTSATLLVDVAAPVAVYYGLRAAGAGETLALAVGAIPPAVSALAGVVRERRVDPVAGLVLVTVLAAAAASLVTGDARALLLRSAWLTAPAGLCTLGSLLAAQPFCFVVTRRLLPGRAAVMDGLWERSPRFRLAWRRITVTWGVVLLADTGLRLWMVAALPVDQVPVLDAALTVGTIVALQVPTHLLLRRSGHWDALFRPGVSAPPVGTTPAARP